MIRLPEPPEPDESRCRTASGSRTVPIGSRSSSPLLLPRLRALSSLLLASHVALHMVWIPSSWNPADAPSRLVRVRPG